MYTVVLPNICDRCQQKRDDVCRCTGSNEPCDHCAQYLADEAEYDVWCGVDEPQCTCHLEIARGCDHCATIIANNADEEAEHAADYDY
jgi:hypothetical protein